MGKKSVRFRCHSCGHCCRDVICLPTPEDVRRIVRDTGLDPGDFLEFVGPDEITEVEEDDPTWLECRTKKKGKTKRYVMGLRRDKKGCFFLDKKTLRCNIYESRPLLCRLYPFKLLETREGKFKGFSLHKDVGCPRHRDDVVEVGPLHKIHLQDCPNEEEYDRLVGVFNEDRRKGKRPEEFIALFMARG